MEIMTKVLVFESDRAFAGELESELGKLGCTVHVVDDGNVGLTMAAQDRPDLILLAIELPRMNGFSVCNKLKKDPLLKDVPLIIMSSESPEDTFEQHRKLRTRAEDYVHKPIAFGELAQRIRAFVPLDVVEQDDDIVIDDSYDLLEPEPAEEQTIQLIAPPPAPAASPAPPAQAARVDAEVDAFIGGAFDRLLGEAEDEPMQVRSLGEVHSAIQAERRPSTPPLAAAPRTVPPPRPRTVPPPSSGDVMIDAAPTAQFRVAEHASAPPPAMHAEVERLRSELERAKLEVVQMTKEVGLAQAAAQRLEGELAASAGATGESERLRREVDDLRRLSAGGSKAGVSSREFLDLRETLNKKDKELLAIRDQVSRKDKENLDLRDQLLAFERERADHADRLLELERAAADLDAKAEALGTERDLATKRGEELKARGDQLEQGLAHATEELAAQRTAATSAEAAHATALQEAAAAATQQLAAAEQAAGRAVEAARGQARADLERVEAEQRAALEAAGAAHRAALAAAEAAAAEALAAREAALAAEHTRAMEASAGEHARAMASRDAQHAEALDKARAEADKRLETAEAAHANALAEALTEADQRFAAAEAAHETALLSVQERADKVLAEANATHEAASRAWSDEKRGLEGRVAELDAAVARGTAELADATRELGRLSIASERERERAETAEELGRAQATEVAELVEARDALRADTERLSTELGREKLLLEKARRKWGEDRLSLERAREALSLALGKITEAEGRPIE
jgi:CheY-like chemotaxis protein